MPIAARPNCSRRLASTIGASPYSAPQSRIPLLPLPPRPGLRTTRRASSAKDTDVPATSRGPRVPLARKHVVINGVGFLGTKIACALAEKGCTLTLLGRDKVKLSRALEAVDAKLKAYLEAHPSDARAASYGIVTASQSAETSETSETISAEVMQAVLSPGTGRVGELGDFNAKAAAGETVSSQAHLANRPPKNNFHIYNNLSSLVDVLKRQRYIDILINCQGLQVSRIHATTTTEDIQNTTSVNLDQTMIACRAASKALIRGAPDSVVINMSSLLGVIGGRGCASYAAAKAGVIAFTRAFSSEMGPLGVRVNCLVAGYIGGGGMALGIPHAAPEKQVPLGRYGTALEVADAVVFLIRNRYANNCVLNLDGGLSAGLMGLKASD